MKVIIIQIVGFCCVALLPSTIQQNDDKERIEKFIKHKKETDQLKGTLDTIALMDEPGFLINGIFRLSKNGYLGCGGFALTYKGAFEGERLIHNKKEVAMKFTLPEKKEMAKKEYDMYTYLKAIDNPGVESFGIPTVYYYGPCDKYMLMAITLLEPTFNQKYKELTPCDILIVFREFVSTNRIVLLQPDEMIFFFFYFVFKIRTSKYIHSCGVRHNDFKPSNVMFRRNRLFIIDYNAASKMYVYSNAGTRRYLPRSVPVKEDGPRSAQFKKDGPTQIAVRIAGRTAKDDWESFLYSMCKIIDYDLGWFTIKEHQKLYDLKKKTWTTLENIYKMPDPYSGIFSRFAEYVLNDKRIGFPDYDDFYNYFDRMIPKPDFVSWLTEANQDIYERNISEIRDPSELVIDEEFYPKLNHTYFTDIYHAYGSSSILFN